MIDIERVNAVLTRAILGLQDAEQEALVNEAMAGGYRVPTPKSMGFKPDKPPKPKSRWKTKKLAMVIKSHADWIPDEHHDVRASVLGGWAVYKEPGKGNTSWRILHMPSGQNVRFGATIGGDYYNRKQDAQKVVEMWVSAMPDLLTAKTPDVIKKNKQEMYNITQRVLNPVKQKLKPNLTPSPYLIKSVLKVMPTNWGDVVEIRDRLFKKRLGDFSLEQINYALTALKKQKKVQFKRDYGLSQWRLITKYNTPQW